MWNKRNKKYKNIIIKKDDFVQMNKKPILAAILAVFLGCFGVNRFYMKRYISGVGILIINIVTAGQLVNIVMSINLIEAISYIYFAICITKDRKKNIKQNKLTPHYGDYLDNIDILNENLDDSKNDIENKLEKVKENNEFKDNSLIELEKHKSIIKFNNKKENLNEISKELPMVLDFINKERCISKTEKVLKIDNNINSELIDLKVKDDINTINFFKDINRQNIEDNKYFEIIKFLKLLKNISMMKYIENKKYNNGVKNFITTLRYILNKKQNEINEKNEVLDLDLEIIDISDIKTSVINKPKIDELKNNNQDWIDILEIPYERQVMQVPQIKEETIKLYEKISQLLDDKLNERGTSLIKIYKKFQKEGGYYSNLLYTIYCIAEGCVTSHYDGGKNIYNNEFSYNLLENKIGNELNKIVRDYTNKLEKNLPKPSKETIEYFGLTYNGLCKVWWDEDGIFRGERVFTLREEKILNNTPYRKNKFIDIQIIKKIILELYLKLCDFIYNDLNNSEIKWRKYTKDYLIQAFTEENLYIYNSSEIRVLKDLLKISEQGVRNKINTIQNLNDETELRDLSKYLPKVTFKKIQDYVKNFKIKEMPFNEIYKQCNNDSLGSKIITYKLSCLDRENFIICINKIIKDKYLYKIINDVLKYSSNDGVKRIVLYILALEKGKIDSKIKKQLFKLIDPSRIYDFENLLKEKKKISIELSNKLEEMTDYKAKKVKLNIYQINKLKKELEETVDIVDDYISIDEEEEKFSKKIIIENKDNYINVQENNNLLNIKQIEFLNLIFNNKNSLNINSAKKFANEDGYMLSAYISKINDRLYDYLGDQGIIIDEDTVLIDEDFIDLVKEII